MSADISDVSICNMALANIGVSARIQALTENSKEAVNCNLFYNNTRDALMRTYAFQFSEVFALLSLTTDPQLPDNQDQAPGWIYSYGYPSDCLFARQICDTAGTRLRFVQMDALYQDLVRYMPPRVPFKIGRNQAGNRVIWTDLPNAYLFYTQKITDPTLFDPLFVEAFAWRLGAQLATPMRVDPNIGQAAAAQALKSIALAQAQSANEAHEDHEPDSGSIQARL